MDSSGAGSRRGSSALNRKAPGPARWPTPSTNAAATSPLERPAPPHRKSDRDTVDTRLLPQLPHPAPPAVQASAARAARAHATAVLVLTDDSRSRNKGNAPDAPHRPKAS